GSGGDGGHTETARQLGVSLGREGRGLLVADVDQADITCHASVVDRKNVSARQGVEHVRPVPLQGFGDEVPSIGFKAHEAMLTEWNRRSFPSRSSWPKPRPGHWPAFCAPTTSTRT